MNREILPQEPAIQFPLRINSRLNNKFNQISLETRINKSVLARLALGTFLHSIEEKGVTAVLNEVEMV